MVMVKTNKNPVRTIPMGPLGDTRTTNMMVNGKRMAEKFSVFPTFHNRRYHTNHLAADDKVIDFFICPTGCCSSYSQQFSQLISFIK